MSQRVVLLAHVPPELATALAAGLEHLGDVRVVQTSEMGDLLTTAHTGDVRVVVLGPSLSGPQLLGLMEELRTDPMTARLATLAILPVQAADRLEAVLDAGCDDVMFEPVPAAMLRVHVLAMLEIRALRARSEEQAAELERLRSSEREGMTAVVKLLVDLMEHREPGSAARSKRIAQLAARVAARFEVPDELIHDLVVAARLCELGRLAAPVLARGPDDAPARETRVHWPVAAECLARVNGLARAAELVQSMGENWDGTGLPSHFLQGQIPLRSRILRVLHDFYGVLESRPGTPPEDVLEQLTERSGTLYDPMVVVELRGVLSDVSRDRLQGEKVLVPVNDLEAGMVLAEDLYADSGVKLLARGTVLSPATLETLHRRHKVAPIPHAAIRRRAA